MQHRIKYGEAGPLLPILSLFNPYSFCAWQVLYSVAVPGNTGTPLTNSESHYWKGNLVRSCDFFFWHYRSAGILRNNILKVSILPPYRLSCFFPSLFKRQLPISPERESSDIAKLFLFNPLEVTFVTLPKRRLYFENVDSLKSPSSLHAVTRSGFVSFLSCQATTALRRSSPAKLCGIN